MSDALSCLVWGCAAKGRTLAATLERCALELARALEAGELEAIRREYELALEAIQKTPVPRD